MNNNFGTKSKKTKEKRKVKKKLKEYSVEVAKRSNEKLLSNKSIIKVIKEAKGKINRTCRWFDFRQ